MALYARKMGMADPKSRTTTGIVMGTLGYMRHELEARLRAEGEAIHFDRGNARLDAPGDRGVGG